MEKFSFKEIDFYIKFFLMHFNKRKWFIKKTYLLVKFFDKFKEKNKNKQSGKSKRLFICTGNINLINILVLIKQLKNENSDDYLIIDSYLGEFDFWKKNYEIAKLHNFKKITFLKSFLFKEEVYLFNKHFFNEIYSVNLLEAIKNLPEIYPDSEINIIDEGSGGLINFGNVKKINKFYKYQYLKKLDLFEFPKYFKEKTVLLDEEEFKNISQKLVKKYPLSVQFCPEDKSVLFCGTYFNPFIDESKEKFKQEQLQVLNDLTNAGYKVYYKPHPRDNTLYDVDKNENVIIVQSSLPIEIYNIDVLAIVSFSTCAIDPAHYWGIPCFSYISDYSLKQNNDRKINIFRFIIKEYSPDYRNLLKFNVKELSREKLKIQIKEFYKNFIKEKPLLSENQRVKDYAEQFKTKS